MNEGDGQPIINNEDLDCIEQALHQLVDMIEHPLEPKRSRELSMLPRTIHRLRSQRRLIRIACQHFFYEKCKLFIEQYIASEVLPSFRGKRGDSLLVEFLDRWEKHKLLAERLNDLFYRPIRGRSMPPLDEVGLTLFRDLVYIKIHAEVRADVISLIGREREGMQIDRALLKKVLDVFVKIGMGKMDRYESDFEASLLKQTFDHYFMKAKNWILDYSCPDYLLKVEECLKREKERCSHYLHPSSEPKLLKKVESGLLSYYATELLENGRSACNALLREDKSRDLHRMFSLFSKIPGGLDLVANIFKQHVTAEGTALVKQAEDATSNKEDFAREMSEFKLTCQAYVEFIFDDHTLFRKARQEAFEACRL